MQLIFLEAIGKQFLETVANTSVSKNYFLEAAQNRVTYKNKEISRDSWKTTNVYRNRFLETALQGRFNIDLYSKKPSVLKIIFVVAAKGDVHVGHLDGLVVASPLAGRPVPLADGAFAKPDEEVLVNAAPELWQQ